VVFVIPKGCQSDYSRLQNIPNVKALTPYASTLEIKQFRLVFSNQNMTAVALRGPLMMEESKQDEIWAVDGRSYNYRCCRIGGDIGSDMDPKVVDDGGSNITAHNRV